MFWGLKITNISLDRALYMVVRIILLIIASAELTYTTTPNSLTDAIEKLLSPLRFIGLKGVVHTLAMMMTIALRFIPTLIEETEKIMSAQKARGADFESGDLIAFYLGNKILVKRCIAGPGQWVDIDEEGNVYIDGKLLEEPYLEEKALGDCNIELPYQVPDGTHFLMGDQRDTSVDSRHSSVGCITNEQIVGKIAIVGDKYQAVRVLVQSPRRE